MKNYIYGLGGRDMTVVHLQEIFRELSKSAKAGRRIGPIQRFVNLRGPELTFLK